jgi:hypothetical protein
MTTPEIIDQIQELILEDRWISAKSVAEQLGILRERVGSIILEDLDMLVACFLPGRAKDLSAPLLYMPFHFIYSPSFLRAITLKANRRLSIRRAQVKVGLRLERRYSQR